MAKLDPAPQNVTEALEQALKNSLAEEEQETSYIPMFVLIFNLLLLAIGFCWYFMQSDNVVMVDSMWPLIWKFVGIAMLVYQIPLLLACRTSYQIRTKRSVSTYIVFSLMAIGGFLLLFHPLLHTWNAFADQPLPIKITAQITGLDYHTGSNRSTGSFYLYLKLPDTGNKEHIVRGIGRETFIKLREKKTTEVYLYKGALGQRWFQLTPP